MAAVRPPAGGQSLKQNYDLDQVYDNLPSFRTIKSMEVTNLRIHINLNPLDMGRPSHWDRTGLSAALDVQDEVGLFFSFIKFPFGLLLALTLRPFCASQVHGAVHARVQLLHLRPPEQRRR